jgi:selenophosphate synthetase-related protein
MKKIILLLCVLSSCCIHHEDGDKILYYGDKCVVIQVNDSTLVIAPGINSGKNVEAKTVFLNREKP